MPLRTPQQYIEALKKMKPNIYVNGELIGRDDPRLKPGINVIAKTYELAQKPEYQSLLLATSHLTGEKINRFTHINRSQEDLLKKQEMIRKLCHVTGGCIQRCMGCDAINALSVVTYEVDKKYGTSYYENFVKFLRYFQENDLCAAAAQTDVKGNRVLRPHQQADPDLYLHIVEKRDDGIVVRGAKNHITMASYADEIIVLPTRAMTEKDKNWAVSFAVPGDWEGVKHVVRVTALRPREKLHAPIGEFGVGDSFLIFDDVFVPWERVFLCGEWEFAGLLAHHFANYHRHSYTGCKPAVTDIMLGSAALVAEYNGIEGRPHVRTRLVEMACLAELVYAAGIASAVKSTISDSGTCVPDMVFTNAGRRHAGVNIYHEFDVVAELAGGLPATLPFERDFYNPDVGPLLEKYIMRKENISAEKQHRCFRFLSDILCSALAGVNQIAGVHGGGSPIMEEIIISQIYDFEERKNIVKKLAGIED
ncbi:aromatic ring hydroxylase [Candidatus Bathyarchaeota archaeon]|nr:MAG: aromatic ring hydroxylase [Candidatus Bathyarchaeota archaeon]